MERETFLERKSGIIFAWEDTSSSYEPIGYDAWQDDESKEIYYTDIEEGDIYFDWIMYIRMSSQSFDKRTGGVKYGFLELYQWIITFKVIKHAIALKSEDLICAISRQAGKSYLAQKICGFLPIFAAKHVDIPEERFFTIFVAVKKDLLSDQCNKLYPNIEKAIEVFNTLYPDTPLVKGTPFKPVKMIIDIMINGRQIPYAGFDGLSAGADVNAGYTSHFMIVDESQEVDFESFNEQIKPFGTRTGGILFAIGTTLSDPDNVLFDMYSDPEITPDRKLLYNWEEVHRYKMMVSQDLADKYERRVQKEIKKYGINSDYIQSQYYVSFDIVGNKFMTIERLRSSNVMRGDYGMANVFNTNRNFIVAGFDPAVVNDYAVLTVGESLIVPDEKGKLDGVDIINHLKEVTIMNKDRHRISIEYLIDEICKKCDEYQIDMLMFDSTAGQEHAAFFLIKELKERGIRTMVIPFSFANKNKVSMMHYLEDSLFNQTIILPREEYRTSIEEYNEMLEEVCYLQKTVSASGTPQFKAPEGTSFFDDCVMSLALMNYCTYFVITNAYKKIIDLGSGVVFPIAPHKNNNGVDTKEKNKKRTGYYAG